MIVAVLPPTVLQDLRRYDTPTLSNAIETFDVRPRDQGFAGLEVRCLFPELGVMVGYAVTATIRARGRPEREPDHRPLWDLVRSSPEPRVVVMQDLDDPPAHGAFWGEVQANIFRALGCVGTVTDGCVRDLEEVRALGFHLFARGPGVSHAYVRLESVGEPVTVAGLTVRPGDLLHADRHGVLLVPHEIAAELPAAADRIIEREQAFIRWLRSPDFDPERLAEMRRARH
ncbi:MAG TPA: RraA family protein [Candidatus Dormibacteraeota bacterium]|nr:RraA family protein [Candidatus Dormibacteraeota bacterium]